MFSYVLLIVCAYFLSGFLLRKESVQRYQIFKQSFTYYGICIRLSV